jgi:molecular chaperone HscB
MDYFELFGIPTQLKVDSGSLSKRFFELSRQYHPDYHATAGAESQAEALEKSSLLNNAWKTFQSNDATIRYVLQTKGLLEEEEKYDMPPAFLMEVMEINEQLMDLDSEEDAVAADIRSSIDQLQKDIYEPVRKIVEGYQEGITSEKELLQVKEYYYKKKYLDRIRRQL